MPYWVVCSKVPGGPVYLPADPYGVPGYFEWIAWTPFLEFADQFNTRELAEQRMIGLTLEGLDIPAQPMLVGA